MTGLRVLSPGMLSLIQDCGRFGVAHLGLSVGGPADLHAHCWANKLLNNPMNSPTLEIIMGNAAFEAQCDMILALTGANMNATLDEQPLENWRSFTIKKGQRLKLNYAKTGFRAYLAVKGGIDAYNHFGSASTVLRNTLGGLPDSPGRALKEGDILSPNIELTLSTTESKKVSWVPRHFIPKYTDELCLAVIESYQSDLFSTQAKQDFYSKPYKVSDKLDRMGLRLEGEPIECRASGIVSEGIAYGSIQFPANGQPIILLNDRQTLGGYPKLGCISRLSLMKLAQARPGSVIQFYRDDIDQQTKAYCEFIQYFGLC
ncbi:biotin-dependent carboxyltransferase family protein [Vibrio mytili]|uniref:Urea amidolyase n=1 Tax=Vibrio mytili TaxID=50718 RepID=A0A0C3DHV0_9VIBR|nr:biotin-dependent carboxyltransferase family protein [Vibrio mytili]KIN10979.1 urea amidolyase [Vibrio mytili]